MLPPNIICVSQEGPANALALNKDFSQVVIAGRNVFKVYAIGETEFTEVCNLRVGKNLNLNFSSIDVAWSAIEENTLATAATNGAVVVWNLGRSGRSKQEHVFSDHKRTVNKVSFHLTEPSLLISGSQDGTMKCFDLRMKEVAKTFISNTESVRDVQFCPQQSQHFAAVSENGTVQIWDVRRPERCLQQLQAHSGPVFACDWHPDMLWLATASRDKTIKVWNMQGKPTLEHTIYTIASVGHVKWRPQRKWQVSSCALVLDCAVHVWDVRRPHVPLATFADHRDVTTALAWQDPHSFLTTSRDCFVYKHRWSVAAHPVVWAPGRGVAVSARGELLSALPLRPLPPTRQLNSPHPHPPPPALGRKQPTAGSLTARSQASLEALFPISSQSIVTRWVAALPSQESFIRCAKEYKLTGASTHELAKHNAAVAEKYNRHMTCVVWSVVVVEYSEVSVPPPPPPRPVPPTDPPPPQHPDLYSTVEDEPLSEAEEWEDNTFHNSGVLGLPTRSIYVPPSKYALRDSDNCGWVSAASAHFVDISMVDWTLPEEAFPLRPQHPPEPDIDDHPPQETSGVSASPSGGSSGGSSGPAAPYTNQSSVNTEDSEASEGGGLPVRGGGRGGRGGVRGPGGALGGARGAGGALAAALRHHADCGDVQTPATVIIVLHQHRLEAYDRNMNFDEIENDENDDLKMVLPESNSFRDINSSMDLPSLTKEHITLFFLESDLTAYIEESLQEQWLLGYIELLHRHKMFDIATEVIKNSWVVSVWVLSQQSTVVCVSCGKCGRRSRPGTHCDRCDPRHRDTCAVCRQVVRGLFAWCQGCAHGGHLAHMQQWTARHRLCPAGCGHNCQL